MISRILPLVQLHETQRARGLNLVVSENFLSPPVREVLSSDLAARYDAAWYAGTSTARKLIAETEALAKEVFKAEHALVMSLSGNLCVLAAVFAFTRPGERVAMLPFTGGGYPFGFAKFDRELLPLPGREGTFDVDTEAATELLRKEAPPLTILGASCIPFPHPVRELAAVLKERPDPAPLVFDGSHVLGLIACGVFQDPLREGADVLMGSTHKSFFGPQGGLLVTNDGDLADRLRYYLGFDLEKGLGLVDNMHLNRVAALGLALEEIRADPSYGPRVVENARALAKGLDTRGVPLRYRDRGYTASHQVILDLDEERARTFCADLEQVNVFIDIGGRIGTAEATHRGLGVEEMDAAADILAEVYHEGPKETLKKRVALLVRA